MLIDVNPELPMRDKKITKDFYANQLGFKEYGNTEYDGHLMMEWDRIQIHFYEFKELDPKRIMDRYILERTILRSYTNH